MSTNLLPCPFCGSSAELAMGKNGDGSPWPYVECTGLDCGAIANPEMWNERAARSAQSAETPQELLNKSWQTKSLEQLTEENKR